MIKNPFSAIEKTALFLANYQNHCCPVNLQCLIWNSPLIKITPGGILRTFVAPYEFTQHANWIHNQVTILVSLLYGLKPWAWFASWISNQCTITGELILIITLQSSSPSQFSPHYCHGNGRLSKLRHPRGAKS